MANLGQGEPAEGPKARKDKKDEKDEEDGEEEDEEDEEEEVEETERDDRVSHAYKCLQACTPPGHRVLSTFFQGDRALIGLIRIFYY
jgi:hypothetical protein